MTRALKYHRPESVEQALELLSRNPAAVPAAGGTQLRAGDKIVIDLSALPLTYVRADAECLRIGSTTPLEQICTAPAVRPFAGGLIADTAGSACAGILRGHRTLGFVLSTDPESEISAALLALDAELLLGADDAVRSDCPGKSAILREVRLSAPGAGTRIARERVARTPSDRAIVSVVSIANVQDGIIRGIRLAACGLGLRAMRLRQTELGLAGAALRPDAIRPAIHAGVEALEIADHPLAGAGYRRAMLEVLITRALLEPSEKQCR